MLSTGYSLLFLIVLRTPGDILVIFILTDRCWVEPWDLIWRGWLGNTLSKHHLVCSLREFSLRAPHSKPGSHLFQGLLKLILYYVALILMFQWVISSPQRLNWELLLARMKGKEEELLASKNRIEEKLVPRTPTSAHHIHSQGGFSTPNIQPGFLGKDCSLCSVFVLDIFTFFPTPVLHSLLPFAFPQLSGLLEERRQESHLNTFCKNYMILPRPL